MSRAAGDGFSDRYEIAGAPVVLHFTDRRLRDALSPAFAHLAVSSANGSTRPTLTVHLWDSSGGFAPPPVPPVSGSSPPGTTFLVDEGSLRAAYQPGRDMLSVFDAESCVAWHWVRDAADLTYWDRASPIRQILSWSLRARGNLMLHAAAVGTRTGGVLLVGRGGSGKSTAALSTLGTTLLYASDDYVAVSADSSPRVSSLYSTGKVEPEHARRLLPHLLPLLSQHNELDEKAVIYVHEHFAPQVTSGFPLRAILVPTVCPTQRESRIVDIPRMKALASLAPSTVVQLHSGGQEALELMSRLVERVPCYGLELGTNVRAVPSAIAELLDRIATN